MPVPINFNDDGTQQQQQQQQGDGSFQNQPIPVSGTPASPSSGSSAAPTIGANTGQPTSSGRFTNIVNYLNANKGYNQQNGGLAGQIYSDLNTQATGIRNNLNNDNSTFQGQVQAGSVQYDPNLVKQATTDPSKFVNNQANVNALNKLRDAAYTGPTSFDSGTNYLNQVNQFQSNANLSQTEPGRFTLLSNLYGTPSYNYGQQTLDNLLLQGNPDQLQRLTSATTLAPTLAEDINADIATNQGLVSNAQTQAQNTQKQTRDALSGAVTGFDDNAQNTLNSALTNHSVLIQQLTDDLKAGKVPANLISQLKLSPGENIYNIPLESYFTDVPSQATKQNVISADDYNKIAALSKLSGNVLNGPASAVLSNYTDPSQAGQYYNTPQFKFNTDAFNNDQKSTKDAYNKDLQPYLDFTAKTILPAQAELKQYQDELAQLNQYQQQHPPTISTFGPKLPDNGPDFNSIQAQQDRLRQNIADTTAYIQQQQEKAKSMSDAVNQKYNSGRQLQVVNRPLEAPKKGLTPKQNYGKSFQNLFK